MKIHLEEILYEDSHHYFEDEDDEVDYEKEEQEERELIAELEEMIKNKT